MWVASSLSTYVIPVLFNKNSSANISRSPFIKLIIYSTKFVIIKTFIKKIFASTNVVGCPMFVLGAKLKILKGKLKQWNKDIFGTNLDLMYGDKYLRVSPFFLHNLDLMCLGYKLT